MDIFRRDGFETARVDAERVAADARVKVASEGDVAAVKAAVEEAEKAVADVQAYMRGLGAVLDSVTSFLLLIFGAIVVSIVLVFINLLNTCCVKDDVRETKSAVERLKL